jgi:hypothetical protein
VGVCEIDVREARCWLLNSFQMFLKSCWYLGYEYGNALVESECGAVPLNGYTRVV